MEEKIEKDFDLWNETKKILHNNEHNELFSERDVWWCALGLNIGSEQDGKDEMFQRPILVLKRYSKDTLLIAPFTSKQKDTPYNLSLDSTSSNSKLIISQLRTISSKRLLRKIETISIKDYMLVLFHIIRSFL